MQAMGLPPGTLGSHIPGPPSIAREGGRERSGPGTGQFCPCTPAQIAEIVQGQEAQRRYCRDTEELLKFNIS